MSGSVSVNDHGSRLGSVNGSGQDGEWFKTRKNEPQIWTVQWSDEVSSL